MVFIFLGLVNFFGGLPKPEEYLPEGLSVILKFCDPWTTTATATATTTTTTKTSSVR